MNPGSTVLDVITYTCTSQGSNRDARNNTLVGSEILHYFLKKVALQSNITTGHVQHQLPLPNITRVIFPIHFYPSVKCTAVM